ncbi:hypothetical protein JW964_17315 [candidate division KSB1 bacterium]|nr:hypothetical protein [candidate division KSB1 bacterium]
MESPDGLSNTKSPSVRQPPTLRQVIRLLATLGGFLGRRSDCEPGKKSRWRGLQRLDDLITMCKIMSPPPAKLNKASPVFSNKMWVKISPEGDGWGEDHKCRLKKIYKKVYSGKIRFKVNSRKKKYIMEPINPHCPCHRADHCSW